MPVVSFEEACTSLCELMGVEPPALVEDAAAGVGFTVTFREAVSTFVPAMLGEDAALLMTVSFGAPPPDREAEALRQLMNANFLMGGIGAPAFGRDPETREVSLRRSLLLSQVQAQDLYRDIAEAALAVAQWREADCFAADEAGEPPADALSA